MKPEILQEMPPLSSAEEMFLMEIIGWTHTDVYFEMYQILQ